MHLDEHDLPVQADGDKNDQLQRVSMILAACVLNKSKLPIAVIMHRALRRDLQPKKGVYVRFSDGNTNNVSADQLISALACWVLLRRPMQIAWMFLRMSLRFGFAQNYKDGLNSDARTKIPDCMFVRALPLFCRAHWSLYPLALCADSLLILSALASVGPVWRDNQGFTKRSPGDVDDNVTILTFVTCRERMPTPFSILSCWIFGKFRPWNLGCSETIRVELTDKGRPNLISNRKHRPVYGALLWYHRAESGGNPEIAWMWKPIVDKFF
jgi:hypothetical protein